MVHIEDLFTAIQTFNRKVQHSCGQGRYEEITKHQEELRAWFQANGLADQIIWEPKETSHG